MTAENRTEIAKQLLHTFFIAITEQTQKEAKHKHNQESQRGLLL